VLKTIFFSGGKKNNMPLIGLVVVLVAFGF